MPKHEARKYFCPFSGQICQHGMVQWGEALATCQFWNVDTSRCSLGEAIGGLRELGAISSALQTLASK